MERQRELAIEAFAAGDDAVAGKLQGDRETAEAAAAGVAEKLAGAQRAQGRAEADRVQYAKDNIDALLREVAPDAQQVAARVEEALVDLARAREEWGQQEPRSPRWLEATHRPERDPHLEPPPWR